MFMTEAEAKKKLCPQGPDSEGYNCAASNCMAWRWGYQDVPMFEDREDSHTRKLAVFKGTGATEEWTCGDCDGKGVVDEDGTEYPCPECEGEGSGTRTITARCGYCGLAGKPEA